MTRNHATSPSSFYHRCGHFCGLPNRDECCECSDTRPHQDHGYKASNLSDTRVPKAAAYCAPCRSTMLKRRIGSTKQHEYHLQHLLLHQQRIIKAQEQDLRTAMLFAQRITYLENMIKAKDAEIQYLQTAITRRH